MAYVAIPAGSSSSSSTPTTFGAYFGQVFQNLTGLSPLQIVPYVSNFTNYQDNASGGAGSGSQGGGSGGTGASVAYNATGNGIITLTGPTSGAGFADLTNSQAGNNQITNARSKKWLVAGWVANNHAPGAASETSLGLIVNGATYVGMGFVGAVATWRYVLGTIGAMTNVADTGITIDNTGNVYKWFYLRSDTTSLFLCPDVLAGAAEQTVDVVGSLPNTAARPYFSVHGAGASDKVQLAGYCCFNEF